ncbi:hypothetical protein BG011_001937, partial [Mortierella polycephala]
GHALWRVSIPVADDDDDEDLPILLNNIHKVVKKRLKAVTQKVTDIFGYGTAENTIHIIVQRPPPVVDLATPLKAFTAYTCQVVMNLLGIATSLPFKLDSVPLETPEHKLALERLCIFLEVKRSSITAENEAERSTFVCVLLENAVALFPRLTLRAEKYLAGRRGHGKVDYAIMSRDQQPFMLGAIEAKEQDVMQGEAQNMMQLDSSLTKRHRNSAWK